MYQLYQLYQLYQCTRVWDVPAGAGSWWIRFDRSLPHVFTLHSSTAHPSLHHTALHSCSARHHHDANRHHVLEGAIRSLRGWQGEISHAERVSREWCSGDRAEAQEDSPRAPHLAGPCTDLHLGRPLFLYAECAALKPAPLRYDPCTLYPQAIAHTALLPRLKAGVIAAGAAALLVTGPAALAADLVVGEEVFNNNCGEKRTKGRRRLDTQPIGAIGNALFAQQPRQLARFSPCCRC